MQEKFCLGVVLHVEHKTKCKQESTSGKTQMWVIKALTKEIKIKTRYIKLKQNHTVSLENLAKIIQS